MSLAWMKRSIVALFIVAGVLLLASPSQKTGAATFEKTFELQQPNAGAAQAQPLAEERFKNIQIFKGQPAGMLMPAMRLIAKELGVECDFCHVVGQFDKDEKPQKNTARQMFGMMMGIAKEFTHGEVMIGCYTCHKGQPQPVSFPPQDATKPEEKKPDSSAPTKPEEKKPPQ